MEVDHFTSFEKELRRIEASAELAHDRLGQRSTVEDNQEKRIAQLEDTVHSLSVDRVDANLKVGIVFVVCYATLTLL